VVIGAAVGISLLAAYKGEKETEKSKARRIADIKSLAIFIMESPLLKPHTTTL